MSITARVNYLGSAGLVQSISRGGWDFLYRASTVKDSSWNVGDRVVLPDGRVFRYGKCGADLGGMKWGLKQFNLLVTEKDAIATAADIGDVKIDITFADTDGVNNDGVIAEDELAGGYISFYRGADRQQRGIVGNTVRANGDTTDTVVYLDAALKVAINEDDNIEVLANPYSDLRVSGGGGEWTSVMGLPAVLATSGQYFWIQTWGPIRITPAAGEYGAATDIRDFYFDRNGSLVTSEVKDASGRNYQHAGFLIERNDGAAGSAAPFIMLQINP